MSIRNRTLMIALLLSGTFMAYAKDVKSLQIVFTDIYMTTICSITPSFFDKGALRGICDTVSIVGTKKIKELMQAVNELQEFTSYKTVPDTRGKVIFLYDDNQRRNCTLVPSSLYTEGNYMSCLINSSF